MSSIAQSPTPSSLPHLPSIPVVMVAQRARSGLLLSLLIALAMGLFWWGVALFIIEPSDVIPVWYMQDVDFTAVGANLEYPWSTPHFVYVPWTAVFLIPFAYIPFELATLIQIVLYFTLLAALIHVYGGNTRIVALCCTSFFAFDLSVQVNIDWLTYLGLLVPAMWSGPLLATKPQLALGVYASYSLKQLARATIVMLVLLIVSFLVWDWWVDDMLQTWNTYTLREEYINAFNLAPIALMPAPISLLIGGGLMWHAFRRKDAALSILAWFFFVPYIPFYSLILYFALMAIRLPLLAGIVYGVVWLVYGGVIFGVLLFG